MPHIHLETTADLPENAHIPDILEALLSRLAGFETISSPSLKAYHTLRSVWCMGEGAPPGIAHCTVSILEGRPLELRKSISDAMYEVMRTSFRESLDADEVSLTLELRQMDPQTYRK
jgi:5-carboxymethyl-2-hydroxymuconate isomerase